MGPVWTCWTSADKKSSRCPWALIGRFGARWFWLLLQRGKRRQFVYWIDCHTGSPKTRTNLIPYHLFNTDQRAFASPTRNVTICSTYSQTNGIPFKCNQGDRQMHSAQLLHDHPGAILPRTHWQFAVGGASTWAGSTHTGSRSDRPPRVQLPI